MVKARDYAAEYARFHGKPAEIKKRAMRNEARATVKKSAGAQAVAGKDVHHKTALRNGVLLFIASEENQFVILGDKGIDDKVPAGFWDDIASQLTIRFKNGEFTEGIVDAVTAVGEHLKAFFPRAADDVDELSNEISVE